ncbi:hypothetical protein [Bradyrhizobium sp.]|jgi:hypothetical protein|uniref:hypothetical protein n=1 Tax=Bradyrhizobium sp. TaxID=376 RepID=UPI003C193023
MHATAEQNFFQQTPPVAEAGHFGVSLSETTTETPMSNVIQVARKILPIEQVVLVEPFVPPSDTPLRTTKEFLSRIVLLDRVSVLSEESPEDLAQSISFRFVTLDRVGTNPAIAFRLETFVPTDQFNPSRPYQSRLLWKDSEGNDRSKLMLAPPDELLAVVIRGEVDPQEIVADNKPVRRRKPSNRRRVAPAAREPS